MKKKRDFIELLVFKLDLLGDIYFFPIDFIFFFYFIAATKTVLDIKIDISMLTNIPVSKQVWRGWPESIADELSLAQIGIAKKHKLYVKPKDDTARNVSLFFA